MSSNFRINESRYSLCQRPLIIIIVIILSKWVSLNKSPFYFKIPTILIYAAHWYVASLRLPLQLFEKNIQFLVLSLSSYFLFYPYLKPIFCLFRYSHTLYFLIVPNCLSVLSLPSDQHHNVTICYVELCFKHEYTYINPFQRMLFFLTILSSTLTYFVCVIYFKNFKM